MSRGPGTCIPGRDAAGGSVSVTSTASGTASERTVGSAVFSSAPSSRSQDAIPGQPPAVPTAPAPPTAMIAAAAAWAQSSPAEQVHSPTT